MPKETTFPPKKVLPIYFVVDTSGSMYGEPIRFLNHAINELVSRLANAGREIENVSIRLGVLEFNTISKWLTTGEGHVAEIESIDWFTLSEYALRLPALRFMHWIRQ